MYVCSHFDVYNKCILCLIVVGTFMEYQGVSYLLLCPTLLLYSTVIVAFYCKSYFIYIGLYF